MSTFNDSGTRNFLLNCGRPSLLLLLCRRVKFGVGIHEAKDSVTSEMLHLKVPADRGQLCPPVYISLTAQNDRPIFKTLSIQIFFICLAVFIDFQIRSVFPVGRVENFHSVKIFTRYHEQVYHFFHEPSERKRPADSPQSFSFLLLFFFTERSICCV